MPNTKTLTADQMAAKLARLAPTRLLRATVRAAVATELALPICHPAVMRETARRLRSN